MSTSLLEICCTTASAALLAQQAGANRIEFCGNLKVGGTTPSPNEVAEILQKVTIPVMLLVRPRGGNFYFNETEINDIIETIELHKNSPIAGFVTGAVTATGEINIEAMQRIMAAADGKPITFHRAFDGIENKQKAVEQLIQLGVKTILTSGGEGNAVNNLAALNHLHKIAENKITILAGGGIRAENIQQIIAATGITTIHSSAGEVSIGDEVKAMAQLLNPPKRTGSSMKMP